MIVITKTNQLKEEIMKKHLFLLSAVIGLASFGAITAELSTSVKAESTTDLTDADRDLVRDARQALINDTTLSKYAQSIRVSAHNGTVTLQGYVASEKEKNSVTNTLKQVHGVENIDNQLKVVVK